MAVLCFISIYKYIFVKPSLNKSSLVGSHLFLSGFSGFCDKKRKILKLNLTPMCAIIVDCCKGDKKKVLCVKEEKKNETFDLTKFSTIKCV